MKLYLKCFFTATSSWKTVAAELNHQYEPKYWAENSAEATLQKKFVSCLPGGHNRGQSGGRKFFLIDFFLCIEMM